MLRGRVSDEATHGGSAVADAILVRLSCRHAPHSAILAQLPGGHNSGRV